MSTPNHPFHLAFPVNDLGKTRAFYHQTLGCAIGRESDRWIDFNFFGHQITAHLVESDQTVSTNPVDGDDVPVRHFGAILTIPEWETLAERLKNVNTQFVIEPRVRFKGEVGEQATMFFYDPCGNALEFKAFKDASKHFCNNLNSTERQRLNRTTRTWQLMTKHIRNTILTPKCAANAIACAGSQRVTWTRCD